MKTRPAAWGQKRMGCRGGWEAGSGGALLLSSGMKPSVLEGARGWELISRPKLHAENHISFSPRLLHVDPAPQEDAGKLEKGLGELPRGEVFLWRLSALSARLVPRSTCK